MSTKGTKGTGGLLGSGALVVEGRWAEMGRLALAMWPVGGYCDTLCRAIITNQETEDQ